MSIWPRDAGDVDSLTGDAVAGRPAWSPDGRKLALVNRDAGTLEVIEIQSGERILETEIGDPAGIQPALVHFGGPSWAPDGTTIAYVCWDGAGDEVCTIDTGSTNADSTSRRQLTMLDPASEQNPRAESNSGPPTWSPDGSMLAVAAYPEKRGAPAGVFIIDLSMGNARRISQLLPNSSIEWMSDSRSVIFSASIGNRSDVFEIPARGGSTVNRTDSLVDESRTPSLAPEASRLAVASANAIVVVEDGNETAVFQVPGLTAADPAWSPNGDDIAFSVMPDPIRSYD